MTIIPNYSKLLNNMNNPIIGSNKLTEVCKVYITKFQYKYKPCITIFSTNVGIIGDIHGDYNSLEQAIDLTKDCDYVIFLGDYIDRGTRSYDCLCRVIELAANFDKYIMLMGNHENLGYVDSSISFYGSTSDKEMFEKVKNYLPIACLVYAGESTIFCSHGGLPRYYDTTTKIHTLQSLYNAEVLNRDTKQCVDEILQNDINRRDNFTENRALDNFINTAYNNYKRSIVAYNNAVQTRTLEGNRQPMLASLYTNICNILTNPVLKSIPVNMQQTTYNYLELNRYDYRAIDKASVELLYTMHEKDMWENIWNDIVTYTTWTDVNIPGTYLDEMESRGIIHSLDTYDMFQRQFLHSGINIFIRGHQVTPELFSCYDINAKQMYNKFAKHITYNKASHLYMTLHSTSVYNYITEASPKILKINDTTINVIPLI